MTYTVRKLNHLGKETLAYEGELVERGEDFVCVRATFTLETRDLGYIVMKTGDVFTEWFYSNRWYNIFRVQDVDSGELKGYYCNLTRPAQIGETDVKAEDLELDIFVKPTGEILLLDLDEYKDLSLSDDEDAAVQEAMLEIRLRVEKRESPFDVIKTKA
jgi:protein associated with RNAse G/E